MNTKDAIQWFKTTFNSEIEAATKGTPFGVDLITAIAYQETGYIWSVLLQKALNVPEILEFCVSDTIDADSTQPRGAFPKRKADLLAFRDGDKMYAIARQALIDMAQHIPGFSGVAKNANKFCHGYGIFQYDLQFFKDDPEFFLQKKWATISACVQKCIQELREQMAGLGWSAKTDLTDTERVYLAIAYNKGAKRVDLKGGFKQGFKSDGRYYGENIFEFLRIAQTIDAGPAAPATAPAPAPHEAPLPAPTPIDVTDAVFMVIVQESALRLRSEPKIPQDNPASNVIARLPDGQLVHWLSGKKTDKFLEIETSLNGAHFQGFAASEFLVPVRKAIAIDVVTPAPADSPSDIPAVYMPRKAGTITKRTQPAGAHSLNEAGQPERHGATAGERVAELAKIIAWLAVDKSAHQRYQPASTATFCNIYAHDYAFLAGAYLPRVWWLPGAIEKWAKGETVEPLYEKTIDEQRANDLFRWFRDFGPRFGWRQTGTLTKLQEAASLGGIGIIVARRKLEGRSGHIVAVVPETEDERAKRDSSGEVIAPLQSQAGSVNFRYGTGKLNWWKGDQFADSAFWIHA